MFIWKTDIMKGEDSQREIDTHEFEYKNIKKANM